MFKRNVPKKTILNSSRKYLPDEVYALKNLSILALEFEGDCKKFPKIIMLWHTSIIKIKFFQNFGLNAWIKISLTENYALETYQFSKTIISLQKHRGFSLEVSTVIDMRADQVGGGRPYVLR